jgi:biopolymer transport protein ExbD
MKDLFSQSFKTKLKITGERPDMTPLIGLFFLLLLFFMLGSSFVQVSGLKVDLPEVGAPSVIGVEKYVITVANTANGVEISFNDRLVNMDSLRQELVMVSTYSRTGTVVVSADKNVSFDVIAKIISMAERARLTVVLLTLPQREQRETVFEQQ